MKFSLTDVERHQLENGLTIITREDHSVPIVTSMLWYRVGSRFEIPGRTGVSHFLEHMMFKGTKRFPKGEIDFITARNGGNNNAFTSHDYTAYYFSFASDRWLAALEMEADRMENLLFDPTEFELEKQVILEEIKMGLDDPWEMLHQSADLLGFRDHPYRFPIIGIEQDVMQLKIEDLRETYEAYYAPNNATLVVVGDIDTANIRSRIQDTFGQIEPSESPPANPENLTIQRESLRTRVERPSNIPRMLFALPAPKAASFQLYPAHLLDRVLSEGKLSRLYARLVEKEKLASTVATEIEETFVPYHLFIRLELKENASIGLVDRIVTEELQKLRQEEISFEEMQRAKKQCQSHFLSELETTFDQALQLGLWETLVSWEKVQSHTQQIDAVTTDQALQCAREFLNPARAVICDMVPSPG